RFAFVDDDAIVRCRNSTGRICQPFCLPPFHFCLSSFHFRLPALLPYPVSCPRKLMFDLQVLALQGDVTRVITFQLARETSNRTYNEIGVSDPHHPLTHHGNNAEKIARMAKINAFHVSLFAYFVEKLKATPDGDGTLLDHSIYLYGSGMGN